MTQSQNKKAQNSTNSQITKPKKKEDANQNKRTAFILAGVVVVLVAAIVGVIGYPIYVAPFKKTVITVDNINIRMDYFIKRLKLSGSDPIGMITQLTNDQIIKLSAPKLGIAVVTPDDIDQTLKSQFEGSSGNSNGSGNITSGLNDLNNFTPEKEAEFKEWYRQLLNNSELSDTEYKDIITIEIYRSRLQTYLEARMPTAVPHAHVYMITVATEKEATDARARWAAGENFTALAKELSLDTTAGEKGGELGWFPKGGVLLPAIEIAAFEQTPGDVSQPLPVVNDEAQPDGSTAPTVIGYNLIMVSERADRQLDDNALQVYKSKLVDDWVSTERNNHTIKWSGLHDSFDSETYAWLKYQLAKSNPAPSSTP